MGEPIKNGTNYRCLECGARGRELPICGCADLDVIDVMDDEVYMGHEIPREPVEDDVRAE